MKENNYKKYLSMSTRICIEVLVLITLITLFRFYWRGCISSSLYVICAGLIILYFFPVRILAVDKNKTSRQKKISLYSCLYCVLAIGLSIIRVFLPESNLLGGIIFAFLVLSLIALFVIIFRFRKADEYSLTADDLFNMGNSFLIFAVSLSFLSSISNWTW